MAPSAAIGNVIAAMVPRPAPAAIRSAVFFGCVVWLLTIPIRVIRSWMSCEDGNGELGDVIQANNERWHRATCTSNTGTCTRLAMTPRNKEGQLHYFQVDQLPGN